VKEREKEGKLRREPFKRFLYYWYWWSRLPRRQSQQVCTVEESDNVDRSTIAVASRVPTASTLRVFCLVLNMAQLMKIDVHKFVSLFSVYS
jgi:hypothetical protein